MSSLRGRHQSMEKTSPTQNDSSRSHSIQKWQWPKVANRLTIMCCTLLMVDSPVSIKHGLRTVTGNKIRTRYSLRSCPLPIIPLCLSREEGMIHVFVGSHVKNPESGLFSDWIGNNTDDLRCSDWPKCRHPLVVVDFNLHFCLRNEQWTHTRVHYEISAGSVFLNLKNP